MGRKARFRGGKIAETEEGDNPSTVKTGRERVNKKTGERVSEYEEVANPAEWVLSPLKVRYCWAGWTFSNPVKGFTD